ncbi:hypothetical protein EVAR_80833_1 [Eumeta japonica]|uniref:Uncharacterized protein n=1 Tax=Eumeta variegata TaxID=151549 RepID=A0A4C1WGB3_EUMVA|nr:hypothetical protein EVAR_80833_1 [Eumeta japonica]
MKSRMESKPKNANGLEIESESYFKTRTGNMIRMENGFRRGTRVEQTKKMKEQLGKEESKVYPYLKNGSGSSLIRNVELELVETTVFLGLILDNKLHLMSYGILLWGHAADVHRIFVLQKRAIRAIYGLRPRVSLRILNSQYANADLKVGHSTSWRRIKMMKLTFPSMTCLHARKVRSTGMVKAIKLKEQDTVTAAWYTQHCLPEVLQTLRIRSLMLHHDNAFSRTAEHTVSFFFKKNKLALLTESSDV